MSLFEDSLEDFIFYNRQLIDDGRGGYSEQYTKGPTIIASAVKDDSLQARRADKEGVKNIYTIATKKALTLKKNDVVQRKRDDKIFQITADSTDMNTPASARLDIRVVSAQEWEFPR